MYRHLAESIKENEAKQFMTQKEVDTLNMYENTLRKKEDTYNKQELEDFIKEFDTVVETVQGSHITIDESRNAMIDNIEIYGKTVQNSIDLTDIKSVGNKLSDGRYEIPIVCTGKNMFNGKYQQGYIPRGDTGEFIPTTDNCRTTELIKVKPNTVYKKSESNRSEWYFYKADGTCIGSALQSKIITPNETDYIALYYHNGDLSDNLPVEEFMIVEGYKADGTCIGSALQSKIITPNETEYIALYYHNGDLSDNLPVEEFMIVEGDTLPTTYESYIEYRTEIILDEPLRSLTKYYSNGSVAKDRLVNIDGVWGVERYTRSRILDGNEIWNVDHIMPNTIAYYGKFKFMQNIL